VEESTFFTVEALANFVARKLLDEQKFLSVSVSARKPSVFSDAEGPGVRVWRRAAGFEENCLHTQWDTELAFGP
jgi:dihydroneopterin aldolase